MYKDLIENYFESHKNEIIENLKKLIAVKSVKEEALPGMPFGKGPTDALKLALEMSDNLGFKIKNYDNYVGTADMNDNDTYLGILAHLDVVAEGKNWTFKPFEGTLKDGKIYGRGASDDKGPAIAALYAMAAVKDMGIKLKYNTRLILGTDEESGSNDIKYYFSKETPPPNVFSPDGDFPVVNTEKGGFITSFNAVFEEDSKLPRIISIKGGYRINVVPPDAEAVIEGLTKKTVDDFCISAAKKTGVKYTATDEDNGKIRILAEGLGAHASTPEKGKNAITALISLLCSIPFSDSEAFKALKAINKVFPHGDYYGNAAGIKMSDEISGELTLNFSIFEYTPNKLCGSIDCRAPICATADNTMEILYQILYKSGIILDRSGFKKPHHTPADSKFIKTLLSAYEKYTGREGYCIHIGGGTYVHNIDGGVCFGCVMPGNDTNMHGADEFMEVNDIITSSKIFAQVIIDLCS